ncbi:hypothetical protein C5167_041105 [Papaver somniferum]|uniref:Uncharacterized protein n=1 Tax=Papaver somniferum TaxID=3469 RepID=A0A4Y7IL07_PAPSO|nr:uncharacterized protein LOC113339617 [Papaver somniferum]XP_026440649.1 uncharacterized protein LOC113339617 [Papaver somniferum]RZC48149.1 hypothetical protein C5167_041105 [Papaver somniferum]
MEVNRSVQAHTSNLMELDQRIVVHTGNSIESAQSVGVLAEVEMPTENIFPVPASMQTSELTGVVEAVAEVAVPSATKQGKFLGAGQLYDEGKHCGKVQDEDFVEVGGFRVQKTHASLYEAIWMKYGHIASNQVLTDFYYSQVVVVGEVMDVIAEMNDQPMEEVSEEVIADWEEKIKVPEKLEFNIGWLRECLDDIKENFAEEKKFRDTLMEQNQAKVIEAEQQLVLAKEKLVALETEITTLLMGRANFQKKCGGGLLLLSSDTNLSIVTDPVQRNAILIEEPIDNNNTKTVRPKKIAKKDA